MSDEFDLFISYAHRDDKGNPGDDVSLIQEIKKAIEREYLATTGHEVRIFCDQDAILIGHNWRQTILKGLQSSKMMLAVVSENYFKSEYCKLEWEHYVETELDHALPGEGITPIYIIRYPDFDEMKLDEKLRRWGRDLKRRQVDVKWLKWWPDGQAALERDDVAKRLREIASVVHERLGLYERREHSPTNQMPLFSKHFKGRQRELHELRANLVKGHVGAITAVNGVPGIGKTELALAYAWGYGGHYPGGRFYLNLAGQFPDSKTALEALRQKVADVAASKGIAVSDAELQTPGLVYGKVCAGFQDHPQEPALFLLDSIDDPVLLQPRLLVQGLPQGPHIHVILTTRNREFDQARLAWVSVDSLEPEEGVAILDSFVPIPDSRQDEEWKAAYQIAERLGGHALALNIVGAYQQWKHESYTRMLAFIEKLGLPLLHQAGREIEGAKIGLDSQYQETVLERLLEPTLNDLARESPAAYRALQLAALCPPDNVPLPWLVALLSAENPEWNTDQPGGTLAAQAVTLLKGLRILVPIRRQRAGLVAEAVHDENLARLHRVYQDFIVRRMTDEDQEAINGFLRSIVMIRSEELRRTWGAPDVAWELWPLLDFAHLFSTEDSQETVRLLDHVAETVRHVGRMGDVERLTRRLVEICERLSASAPENAYYSQFLSFAYNTMGDLYRALGNGVEARAFYEKDLEIAERLSASAPENADYARDLSVSYERMGDLYRALGNGVEARAFYEKALEVRERLSASAPENADYARDLGVSHDKLFNFFLEERQIEEAASHLIRFLQVLLPLAERGALPDPNDQKYLMEQLELAKKSGLYNDQTDTSGES